VLGRIRLQAGYDFSGYARLDGTGADLVENITHLDRPISIFPLGNEFAHTSMSIPSVVNGGTPLTAETADSGPQPNPMFSINVEMWTNTRRERLMRNIRAGPRVGWL